MKSIVISTITIILCGIILLFGIVIYILQKQQQYLIHNVVTYISEQLDNTKVTVNAVGIHFFPVPRIYLTDLTLETTEGNQISVKECLVTPNIVPLFTGKLTVSSIKLIQPKGIFYTTQTDSNSHTTQQPLSSPQHFPITLEQLSGLNITVEEGDLLLISNNHTFTITGIHGKLTVSKKIVGTLNLRIAEALWSIGTYPSTIHTLKHHGSIRNIDVAIKKIQLEKNVFLEEKTYDLTMLLNSIIRSDIKLSGIFSIDDTYKGITFNYATSIQKSPGQPFALYGQFNSNGVLYINNSPISIDITIPFVTETVKHNKTQLPNIICTNAQMIFDKNILQLHGTLKNYTQFDKIIFDGEIKGKHISLPYWFAFARTLPIGIQNALSQLSGTAIVTLSPTKIDISKIMLQSLGITLNGSGIITNFSNPAITLSFNTKQLNINTLIPELEEKHVSLSNYHTPPIDELTTAIINNNNNNKQKPTSSESSVKYDVTIDAAQANFWKCNGKQFSFTIYPDAQNIQINSSYQNFYDGIVTSSISISNEYTILLDLKNVQLEKIMPLFSKEYQVKGTLTGNTKCVGSGENIKTFLASLKTSTTATAKNGVIKKVGTEAIPFSDFSINATVTGQNLKEHIPLLTPYNGKWNIAITSTRWNGSIAMDGPIFFSTKTWLPIKAENIPSKIIFFSHGIESITQGTISFNRDTSMFSYTNVKGKLTPDAILSGAIKAITETKNTISWEGILNLSTSHLKELLSAAGYQLDTIPPNMANYLNIQSNFYVSPTNIRFSNIQGLFDSTTFQGTIDGLNITPRYWTGNIHLGKLDLDTYLIPTSKENLLTLSRPWPIELLNRADIQGNLSVSELIYKKVPYNNVSLPVILQQGMLSISPITASLCGGKTHAHFTIHNTLKNMAEISLQYTSQGIAMLELSTKRKQDYLISGSGSLDITLQATARSSKEFLQNLNGKWRFSVQHGYFKERKSKDKRYFSNIGATGDIINGIISNKNFSITGPGLAITGSGTINLPKWDLNYLLNVDILGIPTTIPIQYYGDLDNPKRKINAASLILGTIGSLGSDTIGLIQDIFSAPLQLFMP